MAMGARKLLCVDKKVHSVGSTGIVTSPIAEKIYSGSGTTSLVLHYVATGVNGMRLYLSPDE